MLSARPLRTPANARLKMSPTAAGSRPRRRRVGSSSGLTRHQPRAALADWQSGFGVPLRFLVSCIVAAAQPASCAVGQDRSRDSSVVGSISHSEAIRSNIGESSDSTLATAGSDSGVGGESGFDRLVKLEKEFDAVCGDAAIRGVRGVGGADRSTGGSSAR